MRPALPVLVVASVLLCSHTGVAQTEPPSPPPDTGAHHHEHEHYPMPADQFRRHMEGREKHLRKRLEEYIVSSNQSPAEAGALRARFESGLQTVEAKVNEVCSDGTVYQQEAAQVHRLAKTLLWHPGESGQPPR
jgi:hypothetical protein